MRLSVDLRPPATLAAPRRFSRAHAHSNRANISLGDHKAQAQRACWLELERQYARGKLSLDACRMVIAEMDINHCPSVYRGAHKHEWYIWSDFEQRRYTFAEWEAMTARELGEGEAE